MDEAVFALLDDGLSAPDEVCSRLCTGWLGDLICSDPDDLPALWQQAQGALAAGEHLVLLADYEWGVRLQGVPVPDHLAAPMPWPGCTSDTGGALRLMRFRHLQRLRPAEVRAWLQARDGGQATPGPAGVIALSPVAAGAGAEAEFEAAIERIHEWIRAGDTYQINHTHRLTGQAIGSPVALYRRLRERQPVPYGALIVLPGDRWVLSCSPELFVRHGAGRLTARPMKGTIARRPDDAAADAAAAVWLAADVKNRAENLMIVDLLRNDLGRIARTGSVRVPRLFEVEPYRTVHQMTSTVQAEPAPEVDLPALLRALFPCGSITGAPKHHTMALIGRLETSPRGLYTGAIGWIEAPAEGSGGRLGDLCLSVAIRTLLLEPPMPGQPSLRAMSVGVGAGIVLDSVAADEAQECRVKTRFVTDLDPGFTLFETMRIEAGEVRRLADHLARLSASAQALGWTPPDVGPLADRLRAQAVALQAEAPGVVHRLRLDLCHDGSTHLRCGVLAALPDGPVGLGWAHGRALPDGERALLRHKTSLRTAYDAAIQAAEAGGLFDLLFVNERGELTEGGRSTLLVRLEGRWFTPPLQSGVLAGVTRAALMADPQWRVAERVLHRSDLARAEALAVCNALRGVLPARLVPPGG
ncbi:para-aminobenzoate synthetase/4-amino-4-deoxychorismate lyase [Sphaerotilus hippei]|uniref:Para-aminobenzoate synthetase/4-amino-4-deoxychorismate lyase n=1 Tax=Sphaerotilus hippei TaxID=744406 RepID=A0A318H1V5_9BURK|nr:bifunctional anthranilate synthase component I family protein/class IV aminotransferase [Sphaerotilus hippei]PXW97028.1 para-aminobenzoate synthetase/4-amino-4-deoxychorismate lyase [Sphaerotilus hippei]